MARNIITPLSRVLPSIKTPIVLGAMAGASGGQLAGAVSSAGGFGFIGAGYLTPTTLQGEVDKAFQQLSVSHADLLSSKKRADFGIGILVWRLTELNGGKKPDQASPNDDVKQFLEVIVKARPRAIWLSFGDEAELTGWQKIIADLDQQHNTDLEGSNDEQVKWFVMIGREQELQAAVEKCRCDVLIVQGCEAGGHGHSEAPPLSALLADVLKTLPKLRPNSATGETPPLLGAGGLADGRSLAALLSAGCAGGVYGTRFVITPESTYSQLQKEELVKAKGSATLRTFAFDDARGTLGWPQGTDGRGLRNKTVEEYERDLQDQVKAGKEDPEGAKKRMERYKQAAKDNDTDRIVIWAGTGVGAISAITPAKQVVEDITREAIEALDRVQSYVQ
ncbi:2-nitropropane dioxygenase, NPD [Kalmanozyma brasiliensis GHG001]|uniref:Nitronate monooxygenase domain-containing protein n=1 Tax=Kalmanozyma brasiliensis (strain GHG001) TaxID=1365824 RepID=V5EWU1_KALBG|nr:2-nitropropane dioxygenase, NPD [Kalmanozyma brasiliensis GHG001]EST07868.1 2-nitropropane dioxygenase, NPD [Kalmanozyma brasiliensis GHG001]